MLSHCAVQLEDLKKLGKKNELLLPFLERISESEKKSNPHFDLDYKPKGRSLIYFNNLAERLLLFSYLVGLTPIKYRNEKRGSNSTITNIDDLHLIKYGCVGPQILKDNYVTICDSRLCNLRDRINNSAKRYFFFRNWEVTINEVGKDKAVREYLGHIVTYKRIQNSKAPIERKKPKKQEIEEEPIHQPRKRRKGWDSVDFWGNSS